MGKTALVTGGTSGIGKEFAYELAQQGYDIIIVGRDKEVAGIISKEICEKYNVLCNIILVDLATREGIDKLVSYIEKLPNIDLLVNAAGVFYADDFIEKDIEIWDRMAILDGNAIIRLTYTVAKKMKEKSTKGTIINISSIAAFLKAGNPMYVGIKALAKNFSMSLFFELKKYGIYIQTLCPGFVNTNLFVESFGKTPRFGNVDPNFVVKRSLSACKRKTICCIPGIFPKILVLGMIIAPKSFAYICTKGLLRY